MQRLFGCVFILLFLFFASVAPAEETVRFSIATGSTAGIYHPLGVKIASVLSKYIPHMEATTEATKGSVENCILVGSGKAALALIVADIGWDAYQGQGKFGKKIPLRTVAALFPNYMHIVTLDGKGIERVMDLKGKRVSTGAPGSGTEIKARRILEAYSMDADRDLKRDRMSPLESATALKDGKIDAYFWDGGLPTSSISELALSPGLKVKLVGHGDAIPEMREKYGPFYLKEIVPARTYFGQDQDVPIVSVWNLIVCHESMKEDDVFRILKTLFDHETELVSGHREAGFLSLKAQTNETSPIPFHPGAVRYFKEKRR